MYICTCLSLASSQLTFHLPVSSPRVLPPVTPPLRRPASSGPTHTPTFPAFGSGALSVPAPRPLADPGLAHAARPLGAPHRRSPGRSPRLRGCLSARTRFSNSPFPCLTPFCLLPLNPYSVPTPGAPAPPPESALRVHLHAGLRASGTECRRDQKEAPSSPRGKGQRGTRPQEETQTLL